MRQHKLVNTILLSNINTKLKTTQFKVRETRDFPFLKFTSWTLLKKKKKNVYVLDQPGDSSIFIWTIAHWKCETQRWLIHKTKQYNINFIMLVVPLYSLYAFWIAVVIIKYWCVLRKFSLYHVIDKTIIYLIENI